MKVNEIGPFLAYWNNWIMRGAEIKKKRTGMCCSFSFCLESLLWNLSFTWPSWAPSQQRALPTDCHVPQTRSYRFPTNTIMLYQWAGSMLAQWKECGFWSQRDLNSRSVQALYWLTERPGVPSLFSSNFSFFFSFLFFFLIFIGYSCFTILC